MVSSTGIKKTSVNTHIALLEKKGVIYRDAEGGGRGYKRHFSCVETVDIEADSVNLPYALSADEYDELLAECAEEAELQLGGCDPSVDPEMINLAIQILAEISAVESKSNLDVDGELMTAPAVWELIDRIDRSTLEVVAGRIGDKWDRIGNKKNYLRKALLCEVRNSYNFF